MRLKKFRFTVDGMLAGPTIAPGQKDLLPGIRTSKSREDIGGGMSRLSLWRTIYLVCIFCTVEVIGSPAQTFTTLVTFNGTGGASPRGALVQGHDGNFYGATGGGGNYNTCPDGGCGTVFKITPVGKLTTLYSFCSQANCADGAGPVGLVLATDGNFYGTTDGGNDGVNEGTVFKITPGAG
jgi:uncharacterized repeat protein (TIGR03803 family)